MLIKSKCKIDQDIDEIKTILNKLGKSNQLEDFSEKSISIIHKISQKIDLVLWY